MVAVVRFCVVLLFPGVPVLSWSGADTNGEREAAAAAAARFALRPPRQTSHEGTTQPLLTRADSEDTASDWDAAQESTRHAHAHATHLDSAAALVRRSHHDRDAAHDDTMSAAIADAHSPHPMVSPIASRDRTPSAHDDDAAAAADPAPPLAHASSSSHLVYSQAQMRPSTSGEQTMTSMRHSSRNNRTAVLDADAAEEDDAADEEAQLTFVTLHEEPRRATNGSFSSDDIGRGGGGGGGHAPTPAYSRKTTATTDGGGAEQRDSDRDSHRNNGAATCRNGEEDQGDGGDKDLEEQHPDGPAPQYTHFAHSLLPGQWIRMRKGTVLSLPLLLLCLIAPSLLLCFVRFVRFSPLLPGPPCVRNILGSELCERFSWYGLRAILVLYFNHSLGWSKDASISMFSYSSALAYFMPLLGGYLSDSRLGKYRTILYFSCLYVVGCTMLAVSALERLVWLSILGLVFIGVGTGGIKPCVSSFGADQFTQRRCINASEVSAREHQISSFFHFFYFSINLGSVGSFILTPLLRQYFGYAVAFAVPAVLLAIATIIFWSARNTYFRSPPAGSVLTQLWYTFTVAWNRR